jgi:WD40 repeat protein
MFRPTVLTGHSGAVYALATAFGDDRFFSGSGDGTVVLWDLQEGENGERMVDVGEAVFSLYLHPGSCLLLIGTGSGGLHFIDLRSKKELQNFKVHSKGIFRIIMIDPFRVACAAGDGSVSIWAIDQQAKQLRLLRQIPVSEEKLRDLAVTIDGSCLAIACNDGRVRLLETVLFNETASADTSSNDPDAAVHGISSISFHPSKPVLIGGAKNGHLFLWRSEGMKKILDMPAHKGAIYRIAFNCDGTLCATAGRDKMAKLWSAFDLQPVQRLERSGGGHSHSVNDLLWVGDRLITAGDDRTLKVWRSE